MAVAQTTAMMAYGAPERRCLRARDRSITQPPPGPDRLGLECVMLDEHEQGADDVSASSAPT